MPAPLPFVKDTEFRSKVPVRASPVEIKPVSFSDLAISISDILRD